MTDTKGQNYFKFDRYQWLKLIAINTLIAFTLTLISDHSFWVNFIYSQAIGISIATAISTLHQHKGGKKPSVVSLVIAITVGVLVGITFATFVSGTYKTVDPEEGRRLLFASFFFSIIIGSVVSYYFYLTTKHKEMSHQLTLEKLKQAEYEQALTENNLKILQAQIEPHFLFNTLSNVVGLIDQRPNDAKKMLEYFTHYLRSSLSRTRESDTTLGDEVAIVNAYLGIQKIRMGTRLDYNITIHEELNTIPFPPLLIQPLVENSVRHGLEPEINGGKICVEIKQENSTLIITVADTGQGAKSLQSEGIGLKNVKERLSSIFQGKADIKMAANHPQGLIVTLQILQDKQ